MLRHYSLQEPKVVHLIEASNRNENFLIEDAFGQHYVLRRYRRNQDERRVRFQLQFQRHLSLNRYPTAHIVETTAQRLFVHDSPTPWALFSFVKGSEYDFSNLEQVAKAGRMLAKFHQVAASFSEAEVITEWDQPFRSYWTGNYKEIATITEMFAGRGVEEEVQFIFSCWRWILHRWLLGRLDRLAQGWVHADYHGRNMLFKDDTLVGLFDFDVLFRGPLAYDLARSLWAFGRERRGSTHIREDAAKLCIQSYSEVRPIQSDEVAAIPMMYLLMYLLMNDHMSARYLQYRERDGDDIVARLKASVSATRLLVEETQRLAKTFGWETPDV